MENNWKILIIDDEEIVHDSTKLCLKKFFFQGRPIKFLDAYSSIEAKKILQDHPDIAIILLDIVLEELDSGLSLITFIRKELKNQKTRIVVRTGQPGVAPENDIVDKYAIHDYHIKGKKERPLVSSIKLALNAYQDLSIQEDYKKILELERSCYQDELNSSKSLASSIAYEMISPINTFLTGINIIQNLLKKNQDDFKDRDYKTSFDILKIMENTTKRYNAVVDMILKNVDEERIDTTNFQIFSAYKNINDFLKNYPFRDEKEQKYVTINLIDDFKINGVHDLLQFTFFNLLKYSLDCIKNIKEKNITITINKGKNNWNYINFKHASHGEAAEKLGNIFQNSTNKKARGLGLPFCKRIIENFGGDIIYQVDENGYNQFIINFPYII